MLYKDAQKEEIEKGKEFGLLDEEIKLYAKPYFSAKQMREIRLGLEEGLGIRMVRTYAHFYYSYNQMAVLRQKLREKELYSDESTRKSKMLNIGLLLFTICFMVFSVILFYVSLFTRIPDLNLHEELIEAKCGEIVDTLSFASSDDEIIELNEFNSKLPGTYLLCYEVGGGLKKNIKTMRIKMTDNRPPEIKLKEEVVEVKQLDEFHCKDYIDSVKDNVSEENLNVGCSDELDFSIEEQDVLYSASDKYGNVGYAKLTVKVINEEETIS